MIGRKYLGQGKFQTNENTVNFQLPRQMALCHNADKPGIHLLAQSTQCQIMLKLLI